MTISVSPQHFQRAHRCFQSGDLAGAAAHCADLVRADAGHFNAWHLWGLVALQVGDSGTAIERFRRSLSINSRQPAVHLNLGHAFLRAGKPQAALAACDAALALRPDYAEAFSNRGNALLALKNPVAALASFEHALAINDGIAELYVNRGVALRELGRLDAALVSYDQAVRLLPDSVDAWIGRGETLFALQRYQDALTASEEALSRSPGDPDALRIRARSLLVLDRSEEALSDLELALKRRSDDAAVLVDYGTALFRLGRIDAALDAYDRCLRIAPADAQALFNRGNALAGLQHFDDALGAYDAALAVNPGNAKTHYHRGNTLRRLDRKREALEDYARAHALDPGYRSALSALADTYRELDRLPEALPLYDQALALEPDCPEVLANRGAVLLALKAPEKAVESFQRLVDLDGDSTAHSYARGLLLHARILCCDWRQYDRQLAAIHRGIEARTAVTLPSLLTVVCESVQAQAQCARHYAAAEWPPADLGPPTRRRHPRIRLAYLSADFRDHPVAQLLEGIMARHDRDAFELIGVALRPPDRSDVARRVVSAFSTVVELTGESDRRAAARLRDLELDIAVDLTGYTEGFRPGILAHRVAPVQINFLGFPGTMGAPYMDYVVADAVVVPSSHADCYSEKLIRLPGCFLPTGLPLPAASTVDDRQAWGLPERGFVFCCFNGAHKILPPVFDVWMRLLQQVDGSVLWLPESGEAVSRNLCREAGQRGVAPERIVFAPRLRNVADHIERLRQADLFLDTLPYNAHKTAVDALRAGLPIVTCLGGSFAGRVCASLLTAAGLPELVASDLVHYERIAKSIAGSAGAAAGLRAKVVAIGETSPLFDSGRYCRQLESAFHSVWEHALRDGTPADVAVEPVP